MTRDLIKDPRAFKAKIRRGVCAKIWSTWKECLCAILPFPFGSFRIIIDVSSCDEIYEPYTFSSASRLYQATKILWESRNIISKELWPSGYNSQLRSGYWVWSQNLQMCKCIFFPFRPVLTCRHMHTSTKISKTGLEDIWCLIQTAHWKCVEISPYRATNIQWKLYLLHKCCVSSL